jgi:hypothetical protein
MARPRLVKPSNKQKAAIPGGFIIPGGISNARIEQIPEGWIGHCFRAPEELDEGSTLAFGGAEGHGKEPCADLSRETILGKLDGE